MEKNIKTFVTDITFMSELIPTASLYEAKQWGLIRANNLRCTSCCRKLCAY